MSTPAATARLTEGIRRITEPRSIAIAGVAFGILAFWLALPPFTTREIGWPISAGLVAITCGIAAVPRGERKLGWWAIGLGIAGTLGAIWLQGREAESLNSILTAGVLASTLRFATPLAFAAMGGIFSERSGVVNIGLEGMMLTGAFFGIWASVWSGSWIVGLLMAMLFGGLLALIHAVFSIHLQADQIVSGFAVNFLALGLTGFLFSSIYPGGIHENVSRVPNVHLDFLGSIPVVGDFLEGVFGHLNLLVWLMFATVILSYLVLFKTPIGLRIRSVGEHPRAAETVGISVYGIRYAAVVTSGMLAALGGAFLSIGFVGSFAENMTSGRGFIALAAVIFGKWRPGWAFAACLLFGFGFALAIPLQREAGISENLISTFPYVLTLLALVGLVGRSIPPAAVGRPYVKQ
ncbi:MAG TPA: ABC transporter permease [Gaiellaceae bacterium]|jgi:simple sugar transport system permease protein|nr:ABC transporter permease [Gaiellaceae bacterium]